MLTITGYFVRLLTTMLVIFGGYNPTGYSYYHWLESDTGEWALKLFVGSILGVLLYVQLRAMWRSLRLIGIAILSSIIGSAIWVAVDLDLIRLVDTNERILVFQTAFAVLLGTGFCWSHIRYRLSGQLDSENIAV